MIEPYQAIGLVSTMWGIRRREEIAKNLDHLEHLFKAAFWLGGLDQPVRLVAIAEGALQGFTDEVMDLDHETYARECAIDIPGPETERIGALARQWNVFVMAQAKARHPEFPGRFFNVGFVVSTRGRGDPAPPQARAAAAGGALGHAAQRVGPLGGALRERAGRVLSRGRHARSGGSGS